MTKREAAIITAHTGFLMGNFDDFIKYVEELYNRPVPIDEALDLLDEIKEKSKIDFISITIN